MTHWQIFLLFFIVGSFATLTIVWLSNAYMIRRNRASIAENKIKIAVQRARMIEQDKLLAYISLSRGDPIPPPPNTDTDQPD